MIRITSFHTSHLEALITYWNRSFQDCHNFLPLDRNRFLRRVINNRFQNYRSDPEGIRLAWDQDRVVGMIHAGILPSPEEQDLQGPSGFIAFFHVNPDYRGAGICSNLFSQTVNYLQKNRCRGVFLDGQCRSPFYGNVQGPFPPFWGTTEGISIQGDDHGTISFLSNRGFRPRYKAISLSFPISTHPTPSARPSDFQIQIQENRCPRLGESPDDKIPYSPHANYFTVVGLHQNRVLGTAIVYPLTGLQGNRWAIYELQVDPNTRGKGLGRLLVSKLLTATKERSGQEVEVTTVPDLSPEALGLYTRIGFTEIAHWSIF